MKGRILSRRWNSLLQVWKSQYQWKLWKTHMEEIKVRQSNKSQRKNTENTVSLNTFHYLTPPIDHDLCRLVHRLNVAHITERYKFLTMWIQQWWQSPVWKIWKFHTIICKKLYYWMTLWFSSNFKTTKIWS